MANMERIPQYTMDIRAVTTTVLRIRSSGGKLSSTPCFDSHVIGAVQIAFAASAAVLVKTYAP